jgi:hypothetical protein
VSWLHISYAIAGACRKRSKGEHQDEQDEDVDDYEPFAAGGKIQKKIVKKGLGE